MDDFTKWWMMLSKVPYMTPEEIARRAWGAATISEREACAKVCDDDANKMETEAQNAIENGEHDEVSAIRSTAWKLSVAANRIRARSNAEVRGA
jgi:hypothetical protein